MSEITVALTMPNYNHATFLKKSLSGMLGQRRPADEILILDDASTDNSVEIIEGAICGVPNVRLIKVDENKGVVKSLNRLLEETSCEWIGYAAADDFLFPEYIETLEKLIRKNSDVGFVSACIEIWDEKGSLAGIRPIFFPSLSPRVFSPHEARNLLRRSDNHFFGQVTLYRRDALLELGGFDEAFESGTDGIILRQLALTHGFGFVPVRCGVWRLHGGNYSLSSAFNVPKFKKLIRLYIAHVEKAEDGLFPVGYSDIMARRMKFGVSRLLLKGETDFATTKEKIIDLVDAGRLEKLLLTALAFAGPLRRTLVLSWLFLRSRPFSPLRFAIQPLRRRIAERRAGRVRQDSR